jgi:Flp pilus assembly protein TadD
MVCATTHREALPGMPAQAKLTLTIVCCSAATLWGCARAAAPMTTHSAVIPRAASAAPPAAPAATHGPATALPGAPKCAPKNSTQACAEPALPGHASTESPSRGLPAVPSAPAPAPVPLPKPAQSGLSRGTVEPSDVELGLADRAYRDDDLAQARTHYEKARNLAPKDPAPQIGLVRVALADGDVPTDFAAAPKNPAILSLLRKVDAALKLDDSYAPAYIERGRLLLILGSAAEALGALDHAQQLAPDDAEAQSALGVALLATGKPAEALVRLRRAAALDPDNAERLTNLGTAHLIQGEVAQAVRAFSRAAVLEPNDAKVHGDLGAAYLALNQVEKALPELDRAVELAPTRATFVSNLSYAYFLAGQLDRAIATASHASNLDPKLGSAWINLGTALAKKGDLPAAERAYQRALALDPSDPRAQANLAELAEMKRAKAKAPADSK